MALGIMSKYSIFNVVHVEILEASRDEPHEILILCAPRGQTHRTRTETRIYKLRKLHRDLKLDGGHQLLAIPVGAPTRDPNEHSGQDFDTK